MESLPERKTLRLPECDYSADGAYFVTFCTAEQKPVLGSIRRGDPCGRPEWHPTALGQIAEENLAYLQDAFGIRVEKYVIMPNHIHLLIFISEQRATARVAPTKENASPYSLGQIIGGYKSKVSHDYLQLCKKSGVFMGKIWQRNYYDHVIRTEADYLRIWQIH